MFRSASKRSIHSVYGGFKNQGAGAIQSLTNWKGCRGSTHTHYPILNNLKGFSSGGSQLISAIEHDINRILAVDWTTDFSGFWADQVATHQNAYTNLYEGGCGLFGSFVSLKDPPAEEKQHIKARLQYLQSALKWAEQCESNYTEIFDQRFKMQREVFAAPEREMILASCTELCEKFAADVPSEFRRKATKDLEWHLWNLRHWVWDAPRVKAAFPITMA
eukprot:TRINITY_DN1327_c0_g2_i1.p1 TRINITY_DN1327_c0_g2~~TRINITY_DN1327_c0_g2_i1.p1  ORF type:complete len:219 (+),score=33.84 TRINITY_DN1327_c0_g2_i1:44-700(+)